MKDLLILALIISTGVFFYLWFNSSGGSKLRKEYERQINELEVKMDSIEKERSSLQEAYKLLEKVSEENLKKMDSLKKDSVLINKSLSISEKNLEEQKKKVDEYDQQIQDLLNNPPQIEGQELLDALRQKLSK